MIAARRCDLHLLPLERLAGRAATILFPDGWYGRPHDTVFFVDAVKVACDPVVIVIRDLGHLLIERDCAVLEVHSRLVAIRLGRGLTRCFGGEITLYESGFVSFVLDDVLDTLSISLHFFMSGFEPHS